MGVSITEEIRRQGLTGPWQPDTDLSDHTTLGVGPRVPYFFAPDSLQQLSALQQIAIRTSTPLYPLGGGSNTLFTKRAREHLIVSLQHIDNLSLEQDQEPYRARVQAGRSLPALVKHLADQGWKSFGRLAGIPGTVGGAVAGNSGTSEGDISEFVREVKVLNEQGNLTTIEDPDFSYRDSDLREDLIVEVLLEGSNRPEDLENPPHQRIHRSRRESQPISSRSAGCMFKNPQKAPAGKLIDSAGLKGTRVGEAEVSRTHANFVINRGQATPDDVLELITTIRQQVKKQHDVRLENEIQVL